MGVLLGPASDGCDRVTCSWGSARYTVWHAPLMGGSRRVGPCIGQNFDLQCAHMSDVLPFSEVKAYLSELADRVERQHDRILVTRNGRPSFVLLSPDDLESLDESLDILRDDELMDLLRRSRRDAEQGKRSRLQDHV